MDASIIRMRGKRNDALRQEALRLRTNHRMSYKEISGILDIPYATLSNWLRHIPLTDAEKKEKWANGKRRSFLPPVERPKPKREGAPSFRGSRTVAFLVAEFVKRGYHVLLPFGDHLPYDMALDTGDGRLVRVQCKTGNIRNGAIVFATESTTRRKGGLHRSLYDGKCEVFAVYVEELSKAYIVPVSEGHGGKVSLRLDPVRNGQKIRRWAETFELP